MKAKLYEKRPIVVEAIQWLISNLEELEEFASDSIIYDGTDLKIKTLEGISYNVSFGDYIIKGIQGEFYPCKEDIFKKTYKCIDN